MGRVRRHSPLAAGAQVAAQDVERRPKEWPRSLHARRDGEREEVEEFGFHLEARLRDDRQRAPAPQGRAASPVRRLPGPRRPAPVPLPRAAGHGGQFPNSGGQAEIRAVVSEEFGSARHARSLHGHLEQLAEGSPQEVRHKTVPHTDGASAKIAPRSRARSWWHGLRGVLAEAVGDVRLDPGLRRTL